MQSAKTETEQEKKINLATLGALLRGVSDECCVTVEAITAPGMIKTGNPYFGRVTKRSRMKLRLNYDYPKLVNDQREAVGLPRDFQPGSRKWGASIPGTPLVEYREDLYLNALVEGREESIYLLDGKVISASHINRFFYDRAPRDVPIVTLKLSSIQEIDIGDRSYSITSTSKPEAPDVS